MYILGGVVLVSIISLLTSSFNNDCVNAENVSHMIMAGDMAFWEDPRKIMKISKIPDIKWSETEILSALDLVIERGEANRNIIADIMSKLDNNSLLNISLEDKQLLYKYDDIQKEIIAESKEFKKSIDASRNENHDGYVLTDAQHYEVISFLNDGLLLDILNDVNKCDNVTFVERFPNGILGKPMKKILEEPLELIPRINQEFLPKPSNATVKRVMATIDGNQTFTETLNSIKKNKPTIWKNDLVDPIATTSKSLEAPLKPVKRIDPHFSLGTKLWQDSHTWWSNYIYTSEQSNLIFNDLRVGKVNSLRTLFNNEVLMSFKNQPDCVVSSTSNYVKYTNNDNCFSENHYVLP